MEKKQEVDYNGTAALEHETEVTDQEPCILITKRWTFTYGFFMAILILFIHRVNLSLAVVCMVDFSSDDSQRANLTHPTPAANETIGLAGTLAGNFQNSSSETEGYSLQRLADELTNNGTNLQENHCEKRFGSPTQDLKRPPELRWSRGDVSILLSSYFFGYLFTQIPGGMITEKYGGRHVISVCMGSSMVASLLMPTFARIHMYLAAVLRVIIGMAGGAMIPCLISMMSHFAPPRERSIMTTFGMSGSSLAIILTFITSGYLCAYGFDGGWASIFYIHGIATGVFLIYWCLEVFSKPSSHPRITEAEKAYILSTNKHMTKTDLTAPWRQILTSPPVLACVVCHICYDWSFFTLLINLPLFMKDVLRFDITQNGLYSSLPYICLGISMQISGHVADLLISKQVLSRLATRRLFTVTSLMGTAVCTVATGFISCDNRMVAVAFLCIGAAFNGPAFGGLFVNHMEIAGVYSGSVYGLTNGAAAIPTMIAPVLVGALTTNGLQTEWRNVFYISAAVNTVGALVYGCFSRVTLEPWAQLGTADLQVTINRDVEIETEGERKENEQA